MERREFMALLGSAAALTPAMGSATAHAGAPVERLLGTWSFVSSINTRKDGSVVDRWGANPRGMLMFDGAGHFSQIITGSESRLFGAKTFAGFGTYTFDRTSGAPTLTFTGCSIGKVVGQVQERKIVLLTADELKYVNPATTSDTIAE